MNKAPVVDDCCLLLHNSWADEMNTPFCINDKDPWFLFMPDNFNQLTMENLIENWWVTLAENAVDLQVVSTDCSNARTTASIEYLQVSNWSWLFINYHVD